MTDTNLTITPEQLAQIKAGMPALISAGCDNVGVPLSANSQQLLKAGMAGVTIQDAQLAIDNGIKMANQYSPAGVSSMIPLIQKAASSGKLPEALAEAANTLEHGAIVPEPIADNIQHGCAAINIVSRTQTLQK